jgi:hypothetical protein
MSTNNSNFGWYLMLTLHSILVILQHSIKSTGHEVVGGIHHYIVEWKQPNSSPSWEPYENVKRWHALILEYNRSRDSSKPSKKIIPDEKYHIAYTLEAPFYQYYHTYFLKTSNVDSGSCTFNSHNHYLLPLALPHTGIQHTIFHPKSLYKLWCIIHLKSNVLFNAFWRKYNTILAKYARY